MAREAIRAATLADETALVGELADASRLDAAARKTVSARAADLVREVRSSGKVGKMEIFLAEYGLSTKEGVALMCLAEAMLRVPDTRTVDALIKDKITPHDWGAHLGGAGSILVNATTWGLMLTGRVLEEDEEDDLTGVLHGLVRRMGEPVIRKATGEAMKEMGKQFVLGRTISEAMKRGSEMVDKGYTYSFDMLGEAARTDADARRYHQAYADAIAAIAKHADKDDIRDNPGISVKLSAIHPRYEMGQRDTMLPQISRRLLDLARAAKSAGIGFNIDAEEADRLDLSLDVIETTLADPSLAGWDGFGIVVQAFGRRAIPVLDWLYGLAESLDRRIMVRLVKGAYWDMEIKRAQVMGLADYPVFTRKVHTDVSYLACARKLLGLSDRIYPQFATHNAHSAAAVLHMAEGDLRRFEFQRLHGMGEALHDAVMQSAGTRCRIYAPVGAHRDLLAYLVRRLLENGANSSFVNQIVDTSVTPEAIARDPIEAARQDSFKPNPRIARPAAIFAPRRNSRGWDLTDPRDLAAIEAGRAPFASPHRWTATPLVLGDSGTGPSRQLLNPAKPDDVVGTVREADAALVETAVAAARAAQGAWEATPVSERAAIVERIADLYEENTFEFLALATREAGKTLLDGIAEVREAVDFLRFYAREAVKHEANTRARGVMACISPWNFPLAIFTGQIAAALASGNAVLAKPAEQTPLIAYKAVSLMLAAGVPEGIIQLLPGDGAAVGGPLTADPRIDGVCFTGSTEVAQLINRQLARSQPEALLIAETGGLNAMIVDSTALLEQAVRDIVRAAFQSAGQRCSALRVLYVQKDVAEELLEMLSGAMQELKIGDPWLISTDVGPVIDAEAQERISAYCQAEAAHNGQVMALEAPARGLFVPPTALKVAGIQALDQEIFGPVLHVATFHSKDIDAVVAAVNAKGYGLTFGLHTRIDSRVQHLLDRLHVGNIYVNRDQIGAVVGSQPFGGEGLSGTGPKAGGAQYAQRFRKALADTDERPVPEGSLLDDPVLQMAVSGLEAAPWAEAKDRVQRLRAALRGAAAPAIAAAAAVDCGPIDLPGPTGESNQYSLHPRGPLLCLGPDPESLLAQVVQALAAGNPVLAAALEARETLMMLRNAGFPLAVLDGRVDPRSLTALPIHLLAYAGPKDERAAMRIALADRDGPIVPLVTEPIAPLAYHSERSVCIDTTAAGGNATLLSAAGG